MALEQQDEPEPRRKVRAIRRHHRDRMKSRGKRIGRRDAKMWDYTHDHTGYFVKNHNNLKACSCEICRNPRRSKWRRAKGKARKELQSQQVLEEHTNTLGG